MINKGNIEGRAYIKAINTPSYFNKLSKDLYSLFDSDSGLDFAMSILTKNIDEKSQLPKDVNEKFEKAYKNYFFCSGNLNDFLDCKLNFSIKDKIIINEDVIAEIKLKNGIVTEIKTAKNPFRTPEKDIK